MLAGALPISDGAAVPGSRMLLTHRMRFTPCTWAHHCLMDGSKSRVPPMPVGRVDSGMTWDRAWAAGVVLGMMWTLLQVRRVREGVMVAHMEATEGLALMTYTAAISG
jgi:hypothetical protein